MAGYDPAFIEGHDVPLPVPSERVKSSAFNDGDFLDHLRFSILFDQERSLARCVAHNVDGASIPDRQYTSRSFRFDPLIKPNALQVDDDRGYRNNDWDRGHLARRKSMSWGDEDDAKEAERQSDYYSNIAPQHENLHDDAWGSIEDWMLDRAEGHGKKANVFTGPVFTDDDVEIINGPDEDPVRIPAGFWKIIVIELRSVLRAAGFLVWQRDYNMPEPLAFSPVLEQVRITTIEVLTGLAFQDIRLFDPLLYDAHQSAEIARVHAARGPGAAFESLEGLIGDVVAPRQIERGRPMAVRGGGDIVL